MRFSGIVSTPLLLLASSAVGAVSVLSTNQENDHRHLRGTDGQDNDILPPRRLEPSTATSTASVYGQIEVMTATTGDLSVAAAERSDNATDSLGNTTNTSAIDFDVTTSPGLNQCQGVCKRDSDCAPGLVCFRRELGGNVPYCVFGLEDVEVKQSSLLLDFCTRPWTPPVVSLLEGNVTIMEPTSEPSDMATMSLALEGNTTIESTSEPSDMATEESIEGSTTLEPTSDFGGDISGAPSTLEPSTSPTSLAPTEMPTAMVPTARPTTGAPTAMPVSAQPTATTSMARLIGNPPPGPLGVCEGDCDSDSDCVDGLICHQRDRGDTAPGCSFGNGNDFMGTMDMEDDTDLCIVPPPPTFAPTRTPTAQPTPYPTKPPVPDGIATLVGNPAPAPLNRCEGDCDSSRDCAGSMICYNRNKGDSVPGCTFDTSVGGMDMEEDTDLCIEKQDLFNEGIVSFRLKWRQGYRWQEERHETFWCMQQSGNGIQIQRCDGGSNQRFEMLYVPGTNKQESLIRSLSRNRCLKGGGVPRFSDCDYSDWDQRFKSMNGWWFGDSFEITRNGMENRCLSQHHHPREGEELSMRDCKAERRYTTSAWEFWW